LGNWDIPLSILQCDETSSFHWVVLHFNFLAWDIRIEVWTCFLCSVICQINKTIHSIEPIIFYLVISIIFFPVFKIPSSILRIYIYICWFGDIYYILSGEVISEHMISPGYVFSSFVIFMGCVLILFWLIILISEVWFVYCWFQFWSLLFFF
jgi:hypothetical protein